MKILLYVRMKVFIKDNIFHSPHKSSDNSTKVGETKMNKRAVFPVQSADSIALLSKELNTASEVPVFYSESMLKTDDFKGIWNNEEKKLAQITSKHYQIVQHKDVARAMIEVLKEKNLNIQGTLGNFGNQMRLDIVFKGKTGVVKDNSKGGIQLGIRVLNSYNRSTSFRMEMFGYRLICQNGMALGKAMNNISEITFHMGAEKTFDYIKNKVERFIDRIIASSVLLQEVINDSISETVEWKNTTKLLEKYLLHKKHRNKICELLGISVIEVYDKAKKKRNFTYVLDDKKNTKMTKYDIYNAITDYASHNKLGLSVENNIQEVAQKILKTKIENLIEVEVPKAPSSKRGD